MPSIRESRLPGVGAKFQIEAASGDRLTIVITDDGRRELFHWAQGDDDRVLSSVTLQDAEARQVAGILGGLTYVPKALPSSEVVLDDLVLEWYDVPGGAYAVGRSIRELAVRTRTGASIVSIVREGRTNIVNPEADTILEAETTLIVAGDRRTIAALKRLLDSGRE